MKTINDENELTNSQKDSDLMNEVKMNSLDNSALKEKEEWKWIDNEDKEVENLFGFSENAELINGRLAMISFLLLLLSELAYNGEPVTSKIFGIG